MNILEQDNNRYLKVKSLAGYLAAFLVLVVLQANIFFESRGAYVADFHTVYVWILAALVLLLVRKLEIKAPVAQRIICAMGSGAFGVYLIEDEAKRFIHIYIDKICRKKYKPYHVGRIRKCCHI